VNPNDQEDIVAALKEALSMPEQEQITRNRTMQDRLKRHNVVKWAEEFIAELDAIKSVQSELAAHRVNTEVRNELIRAFHKGKKRLLLLDYDGTLVPLVKKPEKAKPDAGLLSLIGDLLGLDNTEVVIISGREKETLGNWFADLNAGLIAEHGAWIKAPKAEWETLQPLTSQWKTELQPILRHYVDRTPGSFVEEKDFSLVWHYRRVDPALAERRLSELKDTLLQLAAAYNLGVLEGNKIIEIKNSGVDKGQAALEWLARSKWDFVLAVGDDRTDEDLFGILPRDAYSIRVGIRPSQAKFNVSSPRDVRTLLQELSAR
jgi:trehalose 6-phosphate synthase/phosphatase